MVRVRGDKDNGHEEKKSCRLPKCVVPEHYTLSFTPNMVDPVLEGHMEVRIEVQCNTESIVFNAVNIQIFNVTYIPDDNSEALKSKNILVDEKTETVHIDFNGEVKKGRGLLKLDFVAEILGPVLKGLYRTEVVVNSVKKFNYFTHFEPVSARRCFPCWDEPNFKATFDVSLVTPKDMTTIANMPLKKEHAHETNADLRICEFETTPRMSTYLIAFAIGDFDFVEKTNTDGILVRVFTPKGKQEQGKFALNLAADALVYYKEYFKVPYSLPKLDLVPIQEFPIGAMENWGLVTFRDTRLLVDPQETSAVTKQAVASVISHELSHKWFGNLVTMKWWTDLWLKEGFANFIQHVCVEHFFPEFDYWTQFVTKNLVHSFRLDALQNSHPIEVPVTNPGEIDEIFDDISYSKGASIIKMMYSYLGDEVFRDAISKYLTQYQFSNAETPDLWDALDKASGKPIGKMMNTFTKQIGYPLVSVEKVEQVGNTRVFTLKQEKFWADQRWYGDKQTKQTWLIPLTFCKASDPNGVAHAELFDGAASQEIKVIVPNINAEEWVKLNAQMQGYYRVKYPIEELNKFIKSIEDKSMSRLDRFNILEDLYANVKCGFLSTADLLTYLSAYQSERDYTICTTVINVFCGIRDILLRTDLVDRFNKFAVAFLKSIKNDVGWECRPEEAHTATLLRGLVMTRLITHGDQEIIDECVERFSAHESGSGNIPADLRACAYRSVLSQGDAKTLDLLLNIYRKVDLSEEKGRVLQSLGSIKSDDLLQRVLEFSVTEEVKSSDTVTVMGSLSQSKEGQDLNWKFFKDNIKLFEERYPGGNLISRTVETVTENFTTEEMATDVEKFFKAHPIRGTERTVQQSIEYIRINASWLARDLKIISDFLDSQNL